MPGTIVETHGSRSFTLNENSGTATFTYFVSGEDDEAAVHLLVLDTCPETWFSYVRDSLDAKRRNRLDQWDIVVNFKLLPFAVDTESLPSGGGFSFPSGEPAENPAPAPSPSATPPSDDVLVNGITFSITLENELIKRSVNTVASATLVGERNDKYGGLIGVTTDGNGGRNVMGCERGSPVANIRRQATIQGMTYRYFKTLMRMCGRTNFAPWWIFDTEDAQFVGVEGQQLDNAGRYGLTFEFLHRQPQVDKVWGTAVDSVGTEVDLIATKRGMQFIWFGYAERMIDGKPEMRINEVFVERIFETDDFSYLGI